MIKVVNFPARTTKIKQTHLSTIIFLLMLLTFFGTTTFFALNLRRDIIPDEAQHIGVSKHFSTTWGIPPDVPETYIYGSIQHKPNLYYWINGRLINVLNVVFSNPGDWKILALLRLTSVLYASLTVIFCFLLAREVITSRWWALLPVFLLTNTLMFAFLAGGVNYDNLGNLCCFAGTYYLIRLLNGREFFSNSLWWLIWMLVGTLVKFTVLPLLLITFLIWVVYIIKNRSWENFRPVFTPIILLTLAVLVIFLMLNFAVYGVNLLRFRAIMPSCTMVLTEEQCMQQLVYARSAQIPQSEKFTFIDMLNENVPDPVVWFDDYWVGAILKMTYGIAGHLTYSPTDLMLTFYRLWYVWALLIAIRVWRNISFPVAALTAIAVFYTLTVLQTNLSSELDTGFKHLGIQGRYVFPILGSLYVLIVFFFSRVSNKLVSGVTLLLTLALFLWGSPLKTLLVNIMVNYPSANLSPEIHTIEIGSGREVSQDFISECPGTITQMGIMASSGGQDGAYPVRFRLVDMTSNQVITEQVIDQTIFDQTWLKPTLSPLAQTKDHPYRILVSAADDNQRNSLQLWSTTTNIYGGGDAIVHGKPTNYDLIFRYACRMPALSNWFITGEDE